jgi:hypothetical protein
MNYISMEYWWKDMERGKLKHSEKACPSATLTTNPTQTGLESNPDLHSDMPATNCLSHDIAFTFKVI